MRLFQKTKRFYHFSFASVFFLAFFLSLSFAVSPVPACASDVVYDWVKTVGGTGDDIGTSVTFDSSKNLYITGVFVGIVDFDPGVGVDSHTSNGGRDIFLTKYDAFDNYQWTKTFGGLLDENSWITKLAIDNEDNIYLGGQFQTTVDFDPDVGVDSHTSAGGWDAFLTKYDASGNYQWTKTFGGTGSDIVYASSFDGVDGVYVGGGFGATVDFDPGTGIDNRTSVGSTDAFLTKYDISGNYQWTKTFGGATGDYVTAMGIDSKGNAYLFGRFTSVSVDFNPGAEVDNHTNNGSADLYLSKYDASGNYQWTRTWGGSLEEGNRLPQTIAVDSQGYVYIANTFQQTVDFDPGLGTDNHTSNGGNDIFLTKYDTNGSYQWTRTWGGSLIEYAFGVQVDQNENVYVSGSFKSTVDFDPTDGVDNRIGVVEGNPYIVKYDVDGNYQWVKAFQGNGNGAVAIVAFDSFGGSYMYAVGQFRSTVDFDPTSSTDAKTSDGSYDIFLSKFTIDSLSPTLSLSGSTLINTSSHTYTATLSDTLSPILSLEYQVDSTSGSWTSCTPDDGTFDEKEENASCSLSNLSEGSHTVYFRTSDTSQNISDTFSVSLTVDLTAPSSSLKQTISFKSKDNPIIKNSLNKESKNYVQEQKPKIQGTNTSAKNGTVSFYRKDGGTKKTLLGTAPIDGKGKWNFTLPKKKEQGTIDYRLVFTDQSGNVSRSSSAFQVTRDWKKPDFRSPLPDTIQRNQTVSFTATDTRSGIDFYKVSFVGKGQNKHWIKQKIDTFTVPKHLPGGTYILTVRATDKAGNTKEVQKEYRVW